MILKLKNVSKYFDQHPALRDVCLDLEAGQVVGLLGKNGAGKSTLIKLVNDLLVPDEGEVLVDGKKPGRESKQIISYLPDQLHLDSLLRIREILEQFAAFYPDFDLSKAERLLKEMDLDPDQRVFRLSKGMKEKLQLALALSRRARLYIFDEPLAGVDPATRDSILDLILENLEPEATVLVSTHLIHDIERILDDVVFLDQGEIVLHEKADTLRQVHHQSIDSLFRETFK